MFRVQGLGFKVSVFFFFFWGGGGGGRLSNNSRSLRCLFLVPNIARHHYEKDPRGDPNLENNHI